MHILELVLYSHDGRIRTISFRPGSLNVITGESRAGKSAVVEIIRFCLGSSELRVPAGVISDAVSWFALKLRLPDGEAFVARPMPPSGQATSTAVMLRLGRTVDVAEHQELEPNTNAEALIAQLGLAIGIGDNEAVLPDSATRPAVEATLAHAQFFCFQRQDEIANRDLLFHRQAEPFVSTHIRDVLPYFLGAVPANYVSLHARLRAAREDLRKAEARVEQLRSVSATERDESLVLLREAQEVGLFDDRSLTNRSADELRRLLREVLDSAVPPVELESQGGQALVDLAGQRQHLTEEYRELQATRRLIEAIVVEQGGWLEELGGQAERMSAVSLFGDLSDTTTCPVCESPLHSDVPSATDLREALREIRGSLDAAGRDTPRLQRKLAQVEASQALVRSQLAEIDAAVDALARQAAEVERLRDLLNAQSYVRGRIDHYLESVSSAGAPAQVEAERLAAEHAESVRRLEEILSPETVRDNVTSILNVVGEDMRQWAQRLGLEYAHASVRIDAGRLTVVADTSAGLVPLNRMGSASNWVGYHLVAFLALHKFFVANDRPVPRFLVLDQPEQAFYPPDVTDIESARLNDADRRAVAAQYKLISDVVQELHPRLQVVVLAHAKLDEPWFGETIVEEWRNGLKLIPSDWLSAGDGGADQP